MDPLKNADFGKSASALDQAADKLNEAAEKLLESNSASGFIPNFAPANPVSRALNTERKMGAKSPVIDSHPSVGTYVRDGATQPNFSGCTKRSSRRNKQGNFKLC
jgi:hypothetical protein